jgi:hypothetical protein
VRHRGGLRLRGDDAAYGEAVGPCIGVSRQSLEGEFYDVGPAHALSGAGGEIPASGRPARRFNPAPLIRSILEGGDEFPMNFYSPARLLAFIHERRRTGVFGSSYAGCWIERPSEARGWILRAWKPRSYAPLHTSTCWGSNRYPRSWMKKGSARDEAVQSTLGRGLMRSS